MIIKIIYWGEFMAKVFFKSHNKEVECEVGEKLLDVARNADIFIDAPCNGNQSCGKCKVKLLEGKCDTEKTVHISDEEWQQGYILACSTKVTEDMVIEVPSKLSSSMHEMKIEGSDKKVDQKLYNRGRKFLDDNGLTYTDFFAKVYFVDNIKMLGRVLFSNYYFYFILAGFVLLIGMISAILLSKESNKTIRRYQLVYQQLSRDVSNAVFLVH